MDLGTVIGLVLAFALLIGAMMIGGGVSPLVDAQSALIVIGCLRTASLRWADHGQLWLDAVEHPRAVQRRSREPVRAHDHQPARVPGQYANGFGGQRVDEKPGRPRRVSSAGLVMRVRTLRGFGRASTVAAAL